MKSWWRPENGARHILDFSTCTYIHLRILYIYVCFGVCARKWKNILTNFVCWTRANIHITVTNIIGNERDMKQHGSVTPLLGNYDRPTTRRTNQPTKRIILISWSYTTKKRKFSQKWKFLCWQIFCDNNLFNSTLIHFVRWAKIWREARGYELKGGGIICEMVRFWITSLCNPKMSAKCIDLVANRVLKTY